MKKLRVPLPRFRAAGMLILARRIWEKHSADGTKSFLMNLKLEDFQALIEKATRLNDEKETHRQLSEQRTKDRDAVLKEIELRVRKTRDVLTGVHLENMKNLTDWGFNVIEAPASKKDSKALNDDAVETKSLEN